MNIYLNKIITTKERVVLLILILLTLLYNTTNIASAELIQQIIANIQNNGTDNLMYFIGIAILIIILVIVMDYYVGILTTFHNNNVEGKIQEQILRKSFCYDSIALQKWNEGEYINLITINVRNAVSSGTNMILAYANSFGMIGIGTLYMMNQNIFLGTAIIIFNILFRCVTFFFDNIIGKTVRGEIKKNEEANSVFLSILNNQLILRIWNKMDHFLYNYQTIETQLSELDHKVFSLENLYDELMWLTKKIAEILIVYGIGRSQIMRGAFEVSGIISFLIVSDIFAKGVNQFINARIEKREANEYYGIIHTFLSQEEKKKTDYEISKLLSYSYIVADHVSFSFQNDKNILEDINIVIPKEAKVLVIGKNGEGKSTLLNLLAGLLYPTKGKLCIQDKNGHTKDMNPEDCTFVASEAWLIDGTVRQNILLDNIGEDKEELCELVLRCVGLIEKRDADITTLSVGERQRVCIARALFYMKERSICIFDEALANIDPVNRSMIRREIMNMWVGKTVFWVSHEDDMPFEYILSVEQGKVTLQKVKDDI